VTFLPLLLLSLTATSQADTLISVQRGMRLELRNPRGDVRVTAWDRDAVEISTGTSRGRFSVDRSGTVLRIRTERGYWRQGPRRYEWKEDDDAPVHYAIKVPSYLHLALTGVESDFSVTGTSGDISVETVEGGIEVRGGNGRIYLRSVERAVRVTGSQGRIDVEAGEGDVFLYNVTGDVTAQTVDGNIELTDVNSQNVDVNTVDGNISFSGRIAPAGRYYLSTHDGNVTFTVPSDVNADVLVATFEGGFETAFPIVLRESQRKRLHFRLGSGGADIRLEAFDGDVYLRRRD
jgi:Toastrack DUF4097